MGDTPEDGPEMHPNKAVIDLAKANRIKKRVQESSLLERVGVAFGILTIFAIWGDLLQDGKVNAFGLAD